MIRVLHIFGSMARGGAEMRTVDVLGEIDRSRFALEFCTLAGTPGSLDDEIRRLGSVVHPCRLDRGFVPRFLALLRRGHYDVVHSHVHMTSGLILALARLAGVSGRIAHLRATHDGRGDSLARRGYRAGMHALVDRNATQILAVAAGVLDQAWRADWRRDPRCRVVYNGIDADRFVVPDARASVRGELGLADDAPVIAQIARFDVLKNQPFAVDVLAHVPHAHLVFVGRAGTSLPATQRRIQVLGLADRTHFVGERPDVARYLCGADVSLLTSTSEGLPGVVLESLAAGTPVVAPRIPGVSEIAALVPGVHVRSLDEPPARWAAELTRLLREPRDLHIRARFVASQFSLASAAAALVAVWEAPT